MEFHRNPAAPVPGERPEQSDRMGAELLVAIRGLTIATDLQLILRNEKRQSDIAEQFDAHEDLYDLITRPLAPPVSPLQEYFDHEQASINQRRAESGALYQKVMERAVGLPIQVWLRQPDQAQAGVIREAKGRPKDTKPITELEGIFWMADVYQSTHPKLVVARHAGQTVFRRPRRPTLYHVYPLDSKYRPRVHISFPEIS